jgi:hypothetical protein
VSLSSAGDANEGLRVLHQRLEAHFHALRDHRDTSGHGAPIFALEHGLSEAELALVKAEVCSAVRRRHLPRESWLPVVIYATEVGYDYCGDEYWQTFESNTPGGPSSKTATTYGGAFVSSNASSVGPSRPGHGLVTSPSSVGRLRTPSCLRTYNVNWQGSCLSTAGP